MQRKSLPESQPLTELPESDDINVLKIKLKDTQHQVQLLAGPTAVHDRLSDVHLAAVQE